MGGRMRWWNFFDFIVVVCDIVVKPVGHKWPQIGRIVRLGRLVRVISMVRLAKNVKSLQMLFRASRNLLPMFSWGLLLHVVSLYIGAIVCCEMVTTAAKRGVAIPEELYLQHGSIWRSMYTLFLGVSGGLVWKDMLNSLDEFCGKGATFILTPWLIITRYGLVLGLAGSIITLLATDMSKIQRQSASELYWVKGSALDIFKAVLTKHSTYPGTISKQELQVALNDESIAQVRKDLELSKDGIIALFNLLDIDKDAIVSHDELLVGMSHSRDPVDVLTLMYESKRTSVRLVNLSEAMFNQFSEIDHKLLTLTSELQKRGDVSG